MISINRILCPIDFSVSQLDALHHGLVLAQWYSAQLTLFHVYQVAQSLPVAGVPGSVPVFVDTNPNKLADEVRRFCAPLLGSSGQSVEIVVRPGDAAKEIRKEAERLPCELVILGTHGRSGFERLFLGSVTEKAAPKYSVPVLTIPPPVREPGAPLYGDHSVPTGFLGCLESSARICTVARQRGQCASHSAARDRRCAR